MADPESGREIRELARYQVRLEALPRCLAAIDEFVAYVRWQEHEDPTRLVHIFTFRDDAAHRRHSESAEVKRFASVLYPACLAPVEFVGYRRIASNRP